MANFWLNSKKVEGAGVGQTDRAPSISKLRALERDRQTEQRASASASKGLDKQTEQQALQA